MSRTIQFRGLRLRGPQKHTWAYGVPVYFDGGRVAIYWAIDEFDTADRDVHPETVGQFTGLVDKNGADIYEGDIVREYIMDDLFQVVFTDYANFGLSPINELARKNLLGHEYETIDSSYASTSLTVIGNVHTNPELLK